MRCIADINIFLPVLADGHSHRTAAVAWWDACGDGDVGLCLPVHMALLRLLSNPRVMGSSLLAPEQAWNAVTQLADDPRVVNVDKIRKRTRSTGGQRDRPSADTQSLDGCMVGGVGAIAPM